MNILVTSLTCIDFYYFSSHFLWHLTTGSEDTRCGYTKTRRILRRQGCKRVNLRNRCSRFINSHIRKGTEHDLRRHDDELQVRLDTFYIFQSFATAFVLVAFNATSTTLLVQRQYTWRNASDHTSFSDSPSRHHETARFSRRTRKVSISRSCG
jgi:hypothetical protein